MTGKVAGFKGPGAGSFNGRAGRGEFWMMFVPFTLAGVFVGLIPTFGPLLTLPWTYATLALTSRRLHDLNRTGWWQVLPMLVGAAMFVAIGILMAMGQATPDGAVTPAYQSTINVMMIAWAFAYGILFGFIAFFPGVRGPNKYGEADNRVA